MYLLRKLLSSSMGYGICAEAFRKDTLECSKFWDMGWLYDVVGTVEARPCPSGVNCEKGVFRSPDLNRNDSIGKFNTICFSSFGGALTRPGCKSEMFQGLARGNWQCPAPCGESRQCIVAGQVCEKGKDTSSFTGRISL